jgi:hypothetical protein
MKYQRFGQPQGPPKFFQIAISNSDLQPAIAELKAQRVERIYLGFENNPNKGLTYISKKAIRKYFYGVPFVPFPD